MPCLNEAETLASCIRKAQYFLKKHNLLGEVIVADNGSTDGSQKIAITNNAVLVNVPLKGYGSAIRGGIKAAQSEYIIVGDSDDSHDLENLELFYDNLVKGYDLVVGNRFKGGLNKQDMPFMHRYVGNPVLTGLGNLFFKTNIGDFHCGLRGVTKSAFNTMNLATTGMEFASEMIVKAKLNDLEIIEVPTKVFPSGRSRAAHLQTWPDGWRHLRFLLLYSPKWLFFYPGVLFGFLGVVLMFLLTFISYESPIEVFYGLSSALILGGFQFVLFYALTKIYATNHGLIPQSKNYQSIFEKFTLERGLVFGLLLMVFSVLCIMVNINFKTLGLENKPVVFIALVSSCLSIQIILFSFFFSILGLKGAKIN
ncbi:MAG: glycosyltransferase family 2 protein [Flavobacteriaceae bacterium]